MPAASRYPRSEPAVPIDRLGEALAAAVRANGWTPPGGEARLPLEPPREAAHGDLSSNVAMLLAKGLGRPPREVAQKILEALAAGPDLVASAEIAGPGFLNFRLAPAALHAVLLGVLERGSAYGESAGGDGLKVQVEYVSANPTGPMNVVSARAAAVGSALVRLLRATGHEVLSEFFVNDAGSQVDKLGLSFRARYREALGLPAEMPEDGYLGAYVGELAAEFPGAEAAAAVADPTAARFREWALERMVRWQREDLEHYGIRFDRWFREVSLHREAKLERALADLRAAGHVYEQDGAVWFRSTAFGDEKDRVLVRASGEPTYFLADVAYHRDKHERGFRKVIDLWGPDHISHVSRMQGAMQALGLLPDFLEVLIVQQVRLLSGGQPVKMSKRAGEFVTLRELVDEVGADVAKYFFLIRSTDAHLDFDLDLAKAQSDENPAYYVQYAHARISSLVRYAEQNGVAPPTDRAAAAGRLTAPEELALLKELMLFPEVIRGAARAREPHRLPAYLARVAEGFHRFYHVHRVVTADRELSQARLLLCLGVRQVVRNGLGLLGVSAPERM
jgi:arginyl-tRNA synthetase